ncbi:MAG: hypothetical protein WC728_16885 [Elusimicrobiota bacterium]
MSARLHSSGPLKKSLSLLLATSLLAQQGVFVSEALAQNATGQAIQTPAAPVVPTVGVTPISLAPQAGLGTLSSPMSVGGLSTLPSLTLVAPQAQAASALTAPVKQVSLPASVVRRERAQAVRAPDTRPEGAQRRVAAAPAVQAAVEGGTPVDNLGSLREVAQAVTPGKDGSVKTQAGVQLRKFFDGNAIGRSQGETAVQAAVSHGFGRILGLVKGSAAEGRSEKAPPLPEPKLKGLKAFLTRPGEKPIAADMASLARVLASDPSLAERLNEGGRIRVVLAKGNPHPVITDADIAALRKNLESLGISAKVEVETLPVDWAKDGSGEQDPGTADTAAKRSALHTALLLAPAALGSLAVSLMTWSALNLGAFFPIVIVTLAAVYGPFLVRTLLGSFTSPTWGEIVGGVVSKAAPTFMGVAAFASMYAGHPFVMGAAIGITLALNIFHGIWINTWNNFQNNVGKKQGIQYQSMFNLVYGQLWGLVFRTLAWLVIANTVPVWSLLYWKDLGIATVLGSFFGTLGYQGMNILYDKGRIPRWQRSAIQQLRDIFFVMAGIYLGSGDMFVFWTVFAMQQGLDMGIYLLSRWASRRAILYIADEGVASRPEFRDSYPVKDQVYKEGNPLKDALGALIGSPAVKPFVLLAKWLWGKLRGKPS